MLEKVKKYVEKWQMLSKEDCVIAGVSGGADSVCLLFILLELKKEIGFELVAVHVNHGLRGAEADADEEYVRNLCREKKVPLEVYSADVEVIARERKQSTEETGRDIRREFFEQTQYKYKGTRIALAHHQNDNAETFLFRLARGTGLKGLCGMKPMSGNYIRPLLCVGRKEIEDYMKQCGVQYCTDATNTEDIYARNLIRNQIIPRFEGNINSKTVEHIHRTMEYMWQIEDYLENQTEYYFKQCVTQKDGSCLILAEAYEKIPDVLKLLLIRKAMVQISGREKDLEEIHFKQTEELFQKQTGRRITLPYEMEAKCVYDGVEICHMAEKKVGFSEEIAFDVSSKEAEYRWENLRISCKILNKMQIDGQTLEKSHTKQFDCDIIKNGISFRTRRQGDYITIHPDGRTQKLKTFFINEKIPREKRDEILLVADGNHILWVVGYRVNCAYQVTEHTKNVLVIQVDKGEEHGREN